MLPERILVVCLLVLPASAVPGAVYQLEGQVTSGASLFPQDGPTNGLRFEEYGLPVGGYPVEFEARLTFGTDPKDWSFEFTVTDDKQSVGYQVGGSLSPNPTESSGSNNQVSVSSSVITIDYYKFATFGENFNLTLDLDNNTGEWAWSEFCPVCDLVFALPSAIAGVSSIRLIPEPTSLTILVSAVVGALGLRRPHFIRPSRGLRWRF